MKFGKLILEDGKKLYSLADLRQGNDDDVTMVVELCDGENAWLAELDTSYLQKNSKRLSLSLNEYCIALQLLFTNASNDSSSECEYYICQVRI